MKQPIKTSELIQDLRHEGVQKVKVAVVDMDGILRGKYIHIDKFESAIRSGFGFCNVVFGWDSADVCYDGVKYTGWHSGYPDAQVELDLDTFRRVPWDNNVPFFLGHFLDQAGKPLSICPRQLLRRIVADGQRASLVPVAGCEFEWFNFQESPQSLHDKEFTAIEPLTPGMFGYSQLRGSYSQGYFNALMDLLQEFGVPIEGLHTETGPGVYEAAIGKAVGVEAADRAVLFKTSVKEIAYRHNVLASFMARWNTDLPGCSGHIHLSLNNPKGENIFYDPSSAHSLSNVGCHFLAGLVKCLPEILPMFAPTVNSYKRLVEGFWAPTRATWGVDNRTCAFRVIPGGPKATRIEIRVSGSDINPYLALAATLAAGQYGMRQKLPLDQPPVEGNAYEDTTAAPLPRDLFSAATRMQHSEIASELFGAVFVEHFTRSRIWEWEQYSRAVTDWELKRYFEII